MSLTSLNRIKLAKRRALLKRSGPEAKKRKPKQIDSASTDKLPHQSFEHSQEYSFEGHHPLEYNPEDLPTLEYNPKDFQRYFDNETDDSSYNCFLLSSGDEGPSEEEAYVFIRYDPNEVLSLSSDHKSSFNTSSSFRNFDQEESNGVISVESNFPETEKFITTTNMQWENRWPKLDTSSPSCTHRIMTPGEMWIPNFHKYNGTTCPVAHLQYFTPK